MQGQTITPSINDENLDHDEEEFRMNPIHSPKEGQPSSAFLQSMKNDRESTQWQDTRISSSHPSRLSNKNRKIGIKTKLAICFFIFLGICLFIAGGIIYWSGDYGEDEMKTGLDLLACSSIPLVPGMYGLIKWIGMERQWKGYNEIGFNFDDTTWFA